MCNTHCFSTVNLGTRKRPNVMWHVHCLPFLLIQIATKVHNSWRECTCNLMWYFLINLYVLQLPLFCISLISQKNHDPEYLTSQHIHHHGICINFINSWSNPTWEFVSMKMTPYFTNIVPNQTTRNLFRLSNFLDWRTSTSQFYVLSYLCSRKKLLPYSKL